MKAGSLRVSDRESSNRQTQTSRQPLVDQDPSRSSPGRPDVMDGFRT